MNVELRDLAVSHGMCEQFRRIWEKDKDIDSLVGMYLRGLDFCIINDYPSLEYVRGHFGKALLRRHGIYLDEDLDDMEGRNGTYVFLGKCRGTIRFGRFNAARLYVRHDSEIRVKAGMCSSVVCSVYDNGRVEAETFDDKSHCYVMRRGRGEY